jgi:hypothetical protein
MAAEGPPGWNVHVEGIADAASSTLPVLCLLVLVHFDANAM